MDSTPFPTRPIDVVPLTSPEFLFDLDMTDTPVTRCRPSEVHGRHVGV